jgi:hypothetical protein
MTVLNWLLEAKLRTAVSPSFKVVRKDNAVFFKNLKIQGDDYTLNCEVLTGFEILKVGEILSEVYKNFTGIALLNNWDTIGSWYLNQDSELSGEFVDSVVNLEASAIHKLLLLTSGAKLLSKDNLDLVIALAKAKKEEFFLPEDLSDNRLFGFLRKLYIMPGVAARTANTAGVAPIEINFNRKGAVEHNARLLAFIANDSSEVKLKDHLALDLSEAITTRGSLRGSEQTNVIQWILMSRYEKLAESMTARELVSLSLILTNDTPRLQLPEDILRNRSKAMERNVQPIDSYGTDSIVRYLSKDEQKRISSATFVENLNYLIKSQDLRAMNPPIIYATLAEVLVVRGEKKVLEVARTLEHLKLSKDRNGAMYEATVALIVEALKPEAVDYPFSWLAQISEYSWVLTSHIHTNQEVAKML